MLIILEGMDNTGKTSLANFLCTRYTEMEPMSLHSQNGLSHYQRLWKLISFAQRPDLIITDRIGIIGEEVYGLVLRGKREFEEDLPNLWTTLVKAIYPETVIFIHCNPSKYDPGTKKEMDGVRENSRMLREAYERATMKTRDVFASLQKSGMNPIYLEYDYQSDPKYKTLVKRLDLPAGYIKGAMFYREYFGKLYREGEKK